MSKSLILHLYIKESEERWNLYWVGGWEERLTLKMAGWPGFLTVWLILARL
jgi:hypothetical protein